MKCSNCGRIVGDHVIDPALDPHECLLKVTLDERDWYIHPDRVFGVIEDIKDRNPEDFLKKPQTEGGMK